MDEISPIDFPLPSHGTPREPPLHTLSAEGFEYFCRDLACASIDGVENSDLYEKRGEKQFGADFYVDCGPGNLIIGSCKAHKSPGKQVILDEAAAEFTKYWETYWKPRGVRKFIICLAADARPSHRKDAIDKAKAQIRKLGIECEVWAKRELIRLCAPHADIVRSYLGAPWVFELCETFTQFAGKSSPFNLSMISGMVEAQKSTQTPLLNFQLESLSESLRSGALEKASTRAQELRDNDALWQNAEPKQRAQILRTQAAAVIDRDVNLAAALYEEAAKEHPPSDRYFETLIVARTKGRRAALAVVNDPRTARERGLKAGFQIELDEPEAALATLEEMESKESTATDLQRLKAIAFLKLGQYSEAIESAASAVDVEPLSRSARFVHSVAHFTASLSSAVGWLGLTWPSPYPSVYVRSDSKARDLRAKAITLFEELSRQASLNSEKAELGVWTFAAMVDDPNTRTKATEYIDTSSEKDLFHHGLVVWALARV